MSTWWMKPGQHPDAAIGMLPMMFSELSPQPAAEQADANYQGGWSPLPGFSFDPATRVLRYPGDPPMMPIAGTQIRDETILVYPHAWVLVLQKDGSFECSRMD